ncbi:MAG TPA: hypothetical protein VJ761_14830 [Ktedonobacteraceae bacterium]|nr:hypothetical protein [Ktedonobacteraceae bacterium]
MEPLDTDNIYTAREPRPSKPGSRLNVMFIMPIIGALIVLLFIAAAVFQFDLSGVVDSLVGLLLLLFIVTVILLFWGLAPRSNHP